MPSLLHFCFHDGIVKAEILEFGGVADFDAEGSLIDLPDEFRTVDRVLGPLEIEIVLFACEGLGDLLELFDVCSREHLIGVAKAFHYEMSPLSSFDPGLERRVSDRLNGLEDEWPTVVDEYDSHVTVGRVRSSLNREALRRSRRLEDDVAGSRDVLRRCVATGDDRE
jgi:hypothetical protein